MEKTRNWKDKELEALLVRDSIYIDYFEDILVYDEKTRKVHDFNIQRGRWTYIQLHNLLSNFRFMPLAFMNSQYDLVDKIIQWALIPRTIMMGIFIYFTLALKWWAITAIAIFAYALATPDYLVDKNWDRDFLRAPLITVGSLFNIFRAGRDETGARMDAFSHIIHNLRARKQ